MDELDFLRAEVARLAALNGDLMDRNEILRGQANRADKLRGQLEALRGSDELVTIKAQAAEIERLTRELAELTADRDSWIEQASQRAQETVEAMQQVEAYRLRCEAQDSAAFELVAVEDPDAGTIYRMGERIAELEAEVAALHSAPREPLTDEQCDSIYSALHEWAQECDRHELGLPMFGDEKTRGREVIRRASERAHNIGADAGDDQGEPR